MPEGLHVMGRNLSSRAPPTPFNTDSGSGPASTPGSVPNLFQLPQFYWNHLTNIAGEPGQMPDSMPEAPLWEWDATVTPGTSDVPLPGAEWGTGTGPRPETAGGTASDADGGNAPQDPGSVNSNSNGVPPARTTPTTTITDASGFAIPTDWQSNLMGQNAGAADQAAIYAALMSYMVEATKGS